MQREEPEKGNASDRAGDDIFVLTRTNRALAAQVTKLQSELAILRREQSEMAEELTKRRTNERLRRRLDLEGRRISTGPDHSVFLIIQGVRHLISSDDVYDRFFDDRDVVTVDNLAEIEAGAPLEEGSCLVTSKETGVIHFLAINGQEARLHAIANFDTFQQFGFSQRHVLVVPQSLLDRCPRGRTLDTRTLT